MSSLIFAIACLFTITNGECNWVQESSTRVKSATNVCRAVASNGVVTYKQFVCNGDSVTEDIFTDEGCTQLSSSNTITPYAKDCSATTGTCEYAMMSLGCPDSSTTYTYYPIPTNLCVNDGSSYYIITCSSSGTGISRTTSQGIFPLATH